MQLAAPTLPPVVVQWITPEPAFYTRWDFWLSVFTLPIVLATAALVFVTSRLVNETRSMRQGSDAAMAQMVKHAEASARAADESAKIAAETMATTRAIAQTGQRPWITLNLVGEVDVVQYPSLLNWRIAGVLKFRNGGVTPAVALTLQNEELLCETFPTEPPYGPVDDNTSRSVIGPSEIYATNYILNITAQDFNQLRDGAKKMYLYGLIRYQDIFGTEHHTHYCLEYVPGQRIFGYASHHNELS
jgi:hypothetical protein